ncbi:ATP-binding protein [Tunturiibacter gelidoferens]|uniref:PAS domain S-box-containing protein n=1 Tax=Tunturiibacter gelidiferens TaxID=3069689 RepID=A0ACC5NUJ5_9BACT|nr:PAS domain S-box-containing protein [Edaphobacter lichenicola]
MNLSQFNNILRQVFILPVVALLVVAGALYVQIRGSNVTVNLIQESDARISQATLLSKLIVDEESGLRGYETTGDTRFLQPFYEAESHLQSEIQNLDNMAGADADQKHDIADLRDEHQTWEDAFALPIIATVRGGGQTNDVDLNLHGKVLMDNVRHDLTDIIQKAEASRTRRIARWHRQVHSLLLVLLALALGMGVLIGLFTRSRLHAVSAAYRGSLDILGRRAEELYQSEQQLRTTLESIGDGVITCDAEGRIQMMNPVARELTGWSQTEADGRRLEEIFRIVNETTREPVETPVAKVRRLDRIVGMANHHTILLRKDGTELDISDSGAPIRDKAGNTIGIVLVFRDITMERKTQEALIANEKLAVAGRLAATIAHEIHNPLDSVSNLLYLMRNGASPEESVHFMDMAEQELTRVTQISRAMLGLYRESKAPVVVDLKEMLEEILLLMERRLSDLGVTTTTEMPEPIEVCAFPAELRQVFTNLITNAAEAAGQGGQVKVSIVPQCASVGANGQKLQPGAIISIADNGVGIPDDVQPHLFQPFFTTKGEHGTGLGLWVSRGIINKHGGTISISSDTSDASHGTRVSVFLATDPTINAGGD